MTGRTPDDNQSRTDETIRSAAETHGINPDNFQTFWHDRFGHYAPHYIHEWADRIATGRAEHVADNETRAALRRAGLTGGQ